MTLDCFWTISDALLEYLKVNLPEGKTILELGSGNGTAELVKHWKVYSIEQNKQWVGVVPESTYIYAPMTPFKEMKRHGGGCWYDRRVLEIELPKIQYDLILVDGPCPDNGGNRAGFFKYIHLFNTDVPIIFDDINRAKDWYILLSIQNKLNRSVLVPVDPSGKTFGILLQ